MVFPAMKRLFLSSLQSSGRIGARPLPQRHGERFQADMGKNDGEIMGVYYKNRPKVAKCN